VFELIFTAVIAVGLIGVLWFAFRHRQYQMLLTAGFVAGVLTNGVIRILSRRGLVGADALEVGWKASVAGFWLQFVALALQMRAGYRQSVLDYENRKRRETA
jgi:hypothetical protein